MRLPSGRLLLTIALDAPLQVGPARRDVGPSFASRKSISGRLGGKGKVLCVVRLVFNEAGNKLFWRCPWCPFSRDAPSSMHTHFERRHPDLLADIAKVAYLRPCADRDGKVRAFLSGPTIGSFTNPRPLGPFPTGQPSPCCSSQDTASLVPTPNKRGESPSHTPSKKQRLAHIEAGVCKTPAALYHRSPHSKQKARATNVSDGQTRHQHQHSLQGQLDRRTSHDMNEEEVRHPQSFQGKPRRQLVHELPMGSHEGLCPPRRSIPEDKHEKDLDAWHRSSGQLADCMTQQQAQPAARMASDPVAMVPEPGRSRCGEAPEREPPTWPRSSQLLQACSLAQQQAQPEAQLAWAPQTEKPSSHWHLPAKYNPSFSLLEWICQHL
ncbi:hypothetical protein WJX74_010803 [Apatococcus lobatus]|uniref:Uncharacterized protein n=1 Tax=Apatococcus lobatus TaxID=904363 RepID=A0AAW1QMV1_9CHLO